MVTVVSCLFVENLFVIYTLCNTIVLIRKLSIQKCLSKNGMTMRKPGPKKKWEKRVGKGQVVQPNRTIWEKLEYVGQVGQGEGGLQILVGQVGPEEGGLQIFGGQVGQGQGFCLLLSVLQWSDSCYKRQNEYQNMCQQISFTNAKTLDENCLSVDQHLNSNPTPWCSSTPHILWIRIPGHCLYWRRRPSMEG